MLMFGVNNWLDDKSNRVLFFSFLFIAINALLIGFHITDSWGQLTYNWILGGLSVDVRIPYVFQQIFYLHVI